VRVAGDPVLAAAAAEGIDGVAAVRVEGDTLEVAHTRQDEGGDEDGEGLLHALLAAGVRVRSFTPVQEDLEAAFLRVMGNGA